MFLKRRIKRRISRKSFPCAPFYAHIFPMGRPRKKNLRTKLNLTLPPPLIEEGKAHAYEHNESLSEMIERLLRNEISGASSFTAIAGARPIASSTGRKSSAAATRHAAHAKAEQ
jgi:hypothetical protein